jgi:autotransporter-associated beta strand protein
MNCDENAGTSGRNVVNRTLSASGGRRRRLALALAAAGAIVPCGHAFAQAIFTTQSDWALWGTSGFSSGGSVTPVSSFDFDQATTNGLGNPTSGTSTGAGLQINTNGATLGYNTLAYASGVSEQNNQAFLSAWDPGATANGGSSTFATVAYSGTMYMVYTTPTWSVAPSYYDLELLFQYPGNGYWGDFNPTTVTSAGIIDGQQTTIATYNYTVSAGSGGGFGLGIILNASSGCVASSDFYVDDMSFSLPTLPVINPNNATWQPGGTGNWSSSSADNGNWVGNAPPATSTSNATFDNGGATSGPVNVNVEGIQEVDDLTFNNSHGYTLSGSEVIVSTQLTSTAGANTINSLDYTGTATISISSGSSITANSFTRTNYTPLNLAGGGTLNINTINSGNVEVSGGSTLNITGTVAPGAAFLFDIGVATAADTVNLGTNNTYDSNSLDGNGTIIIGAGTSLYTDEYNGFNYYGSLSGSGSLFFGTAASSSTDTSYTGAFFGTSPNYSGPITVQYLNNLEVGAGATLGNASSTNTLTLDSGTLQAVGNANLAQNITIEDTQQIANNITGINVGSGNTLTLSGHISGGNTLETTGPGTLILAASNSYSGGTNVTAGTLVVGATGALPANSALAISGGSLVQLAPGTHAETLSSLSIDSTSTLDIVNNHFYIDYGGNSDPITTIAAYVKSGYNGGHWNGPGIISSEALTNPSSLLYGVGYADGKDGVVAGLTSGQIEVMYTLLGDANLDGLVNSADFNILAANFNQSITGWDQGDFNYDGLVNSADFNALAANFNQGVSGTASAGDVAALDAFAAANGLSLPTSSVPEPASMGLMIAAGIGVLSRRNRRLKGH